MVKPIILLILVGMIITPVCGLAESPPAQWFNMENWELSLNGNEDEGPPARDRHSFLTLRERREYGITENLVGVFRQGMEFSGKNTDREWTASTRIGMGYHFNWDRLKPFVGASFGYLHNGPEETETYIAGPEVGLKIFADTTTFLYGIMEYDFIFEDRETAGANFDDGSFAYSVGIGINW